MCNVQEMARIPPSWILLASQSTVDVFCNPKILGKIREANRHLVLYCKCRNCSSNQEGRIERIWNHMVPSYWHSKQTVPKKYHVNFDSGSNE